MRAAPLAILIAALFAAGACVKTSNLPAGADVGPDPTLPEPRKELIPNVNIAPAVGWAEGAKPTPAAGLQVTAFARNLDHPRWVYVLPNGDVLVAETNAPKRPAHDDGLRAKVMGFVMKKAGAATPSADRITLLRDADGDGVAETRGVFLANLNSPFGMALVGKDFYVANTDAIVKFPYEEGAASIKGPGTKVTDLPAGDYNHHWTKNVIASPDGSKLYATVGSNSNVGEKGMAMEEGRAAIWEVDVATGNKRLFATGIRNPNGLAWEPTTGALWTAVNERDEIGPDLVPDYITSVRDGAFYGWPYSYYGSIVDERVEPQKPELVAKAVKPDYAMGNHVAALGLAWSGENQLGPTYATGMFVGEHGSWNRRPAAGYQVVFVPFSGGKPSGMPLAVLTGFLNADEKAQGRPVGVAMDKRGGLLVADDVGNVIWRVSAAGAR